MGLEVLMASPLLLPKPSQRSVPETLNPHSRIVVSGPQSTWDCINKMEMVSIILRHQQDSRIRDMMNCHPPQHQLLEGRPVRAISHVATPPSATPQQLPLVPVTLRVFDVAENMLFRQNKNIIQESDSFQHRQKCQGAVSKRVPPSTSNLISPMLRPKTDKKCLLVPSPPVPHRHRSTQ